MSIQPYGRSPFGEINHRLDTAAETLVDGWLYIQDVLPVLIKYQAIQWTRDAVRRAPLLTDDERAAILQWLRYRGW